MRHLLGLVRRSTSWGVLILVLTSLVGNAQERHLVTGEPAGSDFLRATFEVEAKALRPGETWKSDRLEIYNLALPEFAPTLLAFSDHPEKIHGRGQLFSGSLSLLQPLRFQYYHLGQVRRGAHLRLEAHNASQKTLRLHLLEAIGGPSTNYFKAGHENNTQFLERWSQNQGRVLELPPGTTVLRSLALPYDKVVSGTAQMTLLDGGPVDFTLQALESPDEPSDHALLQAPEDVHARGFYPVADKRIVRGFSPKTDHFIAAFGAVRQDNIWGEKELRGNYGVLYHFELHLDNPENYPQTVTLNFNPRGGVATGSFWIEQRGLVTIPEVKAFAEHTLYSLTLRPGELRKLNLWTIPEGASSYPVRLIVSRTKANSKEVMGDGLQNFKEESEGL